MKLDSEKIKIAMARKCMTRKELAKAYGCTVPHVDALLRGKKAQPATVGKLARALGVDVLEILEREEKDC